MLLLQALLLLLIVPASWGRYEDFDDGEELAEFDDNDFVEFEDANQDPVVKAEPGPSLQDGPPAAVQDDEEAVLELEEQPEDFEDVETLVSGWGDGPMHFTR